MSSQTDRACQDAYDSIAGSRQRNGQGRDQPSQQEYLERIAAYNRLLDKHVISLDKQKANPVAQKILARAISNCSNLDFTESQLHFLGN